MKSPPSEYFLPLAFAFLPRFKDKLIFVTAQFGANFGVSTTAIRTNMPSTKKKRALPGDADEGSASAEPSSKRKKRDVELNHVSVHYGSYMYFWNLSIYKD